MSDAEMMRFMASCMLADGPAPSVETPLHSILPHRVIAHTHDVATMSLTNVGEGTAERLVGELFEGGIVYVPYIRPGFPLARSVSEMVGRIPPDAIGLTLAHHGLVVWGDDAPECHARLTRRWWPHRRVSRGRPARPAAAGPCARASCRPADQRNRLAEVVLPVVRGELGKPDRVVLHFDDDEDVLADPGARSAPRAGRAGEWRRRSTCFAPGGCRSGWSSIRRPPEDATGRAGADGLAAARAEYEEYHRRNAAGGERPLDDWAKVVLAPGLGVITAFSDKRGAMTANACYRAVLETIENAEAVDRFEFIPERDVFEFEHWPLERRKVDEQIAKDRATRLLPRQSWW